MTIKTIDTDVAFADFWTERQICLKEIISVHGENSDETKYYRDANTKIQNKNMNSIKKHLTNYINVKQIREGKVIMQQVEEQVHFNHICYDLADLLYRKLIRYGIGLTEQRNICALIDNETSYEAIGKYQKLIEDIYKYYAEILQKYQKNNISNDTNLELFKENLILELDKYLTTFYISYSCRTNTCCLQLLLNFGKNYSDVGVINIFKQCRLSAIVMPWSRIEGIELQDIPNKFFKNEKCCFSFDIDIIQTYIRETNVELNYELDQIEGQSSQKTRYINFLLSKLQKHLNTEFVQRKHDFKSIMNTVDNQRKQILNENEQRIEQPIREPIIKKGVSADQLQQNQNEKGVQQQLLEREQKIRKQKNEQLQLLNPNEKNTKNQEIREDNLLKVLFQNKLNTQIKSQEADEYSDEFEEQKKQIANRNTAELRQENIKLLALQEKQNQLKQQDKQLSIQQTIDDQYASTQQNNVSLIDKFDASQQTQLQRAIGQVESMQKSCETQINNKHDDVNHDGQHLIVMDQLDSNKIPEVDSKDDAHCKTEKDNPTQLQKGEDKVDYQNQIYELQYEDCNLYQHVNADQNVAAQQQQEVLKQQSEADTLHLSANKFFDELRNRLNIPIDTTIPKDDEFLTKYRNTTYDMVNMNITNLETINDLQNREFKIVFANLQKNKMISTYEVDMLANLTAQWRNNNLNKECYIVYVAYDDINKYQEEKDKHYEQNETQIKINTQKEIKKKIEQYAQHLNKVENQYNQIWVFSVMYTKNHYISYCTLINREQAYTTYMYDSLNYPLTQYETLTESYKEYVSQILVDLDRSKGQQIPDFNVVQMKQEKQEPNNCGFASVITALYISQNHPDIVYYKEKLDEELRTLFRCLIYQAYLQNETYKNQFPAIDINQSKELIQQTELVERKKEKLKQDNVKQIQKEKIQSTNIKAKQVKIQQIQQESEQIKLDEALAQNAYREQLQQRNDNYMKIYQGWLTEYNMNFKIIIVNVGIEYFNEFFTKFNQDEIPEKFYIKHYLTSIIEKEEIESKLKQAGDSNIVVQLIRKAKEGSVRVTYEDTRSYIDQCINVICSFIGQINKTIYVLLPPTIINLRNTKTITDKFYELVTRNYVIYADIYMEYVKELKRNQCIAQFFDFAAVVSKETISTYYQIELDLTEAQKERVAIFAYE